MRLQALEKYGITLKHEFPIIAEDGIYTYMKNMCFIQDENTDYMVKIIMIHKKFITYTIFKNIVEGRLIGPFPDNITHFEYQDK